MPLKASRVGVRSDQVDSYGRVASSSLFRDIIRDLPRWTDLTVWKHGLEQLLPPNTSTPSTSPFLGDIQYPDVLRNNQEFTYRESPTTVDGLAKIRSIKGNTVVWNQLVPICTRASATGSGITVTNNNDGSFTMDGTGTNININYWIWGNYSTGVTLTTLKAGHKYYVKDCNLYKDDGVGILVQYISNRNNILNVTTDTSLGGVRTLSLDSATQTLTNLKIYPMIIDLTLMFGSGNEPTIDEFTSLFPLSYYSYNSGSLLNFNGTGIKTVGFNQWDGTTLAEHTAIIANSGGYYTVGADCRATDFIPVIGGKDYYFSQSQFLLSSTYGTAWYDANHTFISGFSHSYGSVVVGVRTAPTNACYVRTTIRDTELATTCINISSSRNGEYEPYTSSTLSLPISTYFPSGMKSAGSVYDELTSNKATTRVGTVTFDGSETWNPGGWGSGTRVLIDLPISANGGVSADSPLLHYSTIQEVGAIRGYSAGGGRLDVYLDSTQFSNVSAWTTYLASNPLTINYELATPVVQSTIVFDS